MQKDWLVHDIKERPADIFISYKRQDRPRIEALARALRQLGVDVWFDARLVPGHEFEEVIQAQANAVRAMIVCWTAACFTMDDSGYVRFEAGIGHKRGVLAPISLEPMGSFALPHPFEKLHTEDLSQWLTSYGIALDAEGQHGVLDDAVFQRLLYRLGEPTLLARPGLAPLAKVHAALARIGEPSHQASHSSLEKVTELGRNWLLQFGDDPGAAALAHQLVDYEYAALGARLQSQYGKLLIDWSPPGAESAQRERGLRFEVERLRSLVSAKEAHVDQLTRSLERRSPADTVHAKAEKDVRRTQDLGALEQISTSSLAPHPKEGEQWAETLVLSHGSYTMAVQDYYDSTATADVPYSVKCASYSPDGKRIVTGSTENIARIWNATTGMQVAVIDGHGGEPAAIIHSPDGGKLATIFGMNACLWDSATGTLLYKLGGHIGRVTAVAFSRDGARVATVSLDETARIWDANSGLLLTSLKGHQNWVNDVAFSPDGTRLLTASGSVTGLKDNTARIWDVATGALLNVLSGHEGRLNVAEFSPDGSRIVTAAYDRTARIWDASTGAEVAILKAHTESIRAAKFSPDGSRIVTASYDQTARIWDAKLGAELGVLSGHTDTLNAVAFSLDGLRIVTASGAGGYYNPNPRQNDNTAQVWNASTGSQLAILRGHRDKVSVAQFSSDGTHILTASDDGTARVWTLAPV
ncbi:MAG: toll/interleukin-1 receptor domain-containing protein [Pseudorhodoplanes sp.]